MDCSVIFFYYLDPKFHNFIKMGSKTCESIKSLDFYFCWVSVPLASTKHLDTLAVYGLSFFSSFFSILSTLSFLAALGDWAPSPLVRVCSAKVGSTKVTSLEGVEIPLGEAFLIGLSFGATWSADTAVFLAFVSLQIVSFRFIDLRRTKLRSSFIASSYSSISVTSRRLPRPRLSCLSAYLTLFLRGGRYKIFELS